MKREKMSEMMPTFWASQEIADMVRYFTDKYGMSKAKAIRHIMDNGIQYMAIYGEGMVSDGEEV
jgi:hypothetical protein